MRKYSVIEKHDSENQIHKMKYTFELIKESKVFDVIEDYFELSYLYSGQIKELFKNNGFDIDNLYGWYDFSEVDSNNNRMLIYVLSNNTVSDC